MKKVPPAILLDGKYQCPECFKVLHKFGYSNHYKMAHLGVVSPFSRESPHYQEGSWNKGLKGDPRLSKNGRDKNGVSLFSKGSRNYQEKAWNKGLTKKKQMKELPNP